MINIDYKKIVENLDSVVIVVDYDNKIVYANRYFCSLFNTNCEMLAGKSLYDFLPEHADTVLFRGAVTDSTGSFPYRFIVADVVSNSVTRLANYVTLNKGRADGVEPDMGVVSDRGVVGIVSTVSEHFSVVIPLLNPKSRLSCKILGSNYFGSLTWNGHDARLANLEELPRHVKFEKGDTVVTSGYSAVFPAGIIVGRVVDYKKQRDDNFYSLDVELATDFRVLDHVRIIKNYRQAEQKKVEQEAKKND